METVSTAVREKDAIDKLIDICAEAKDANIRYILLGSREKPETDEAYRAELTKLERRLRKGPNHRNNMIKRIVNLAFLYIISKYTSISVDVSSNCEARISNVVRNLYNSYNVSDDVIQYIILNVALGLDASDEFKDKFELIANKSEFYRNTNEYINIFNRIIKLRNASTKSKSLDTSAPEILHKLMLKMRFICDLKIMPSAEFADDNSKIIPCEFELDGKSYPAKYAVAICREDDYDRFMFLRSIDDFVTSDGEKHLRLNYTDISGDDTGENIEVTVLAVDNTYDFERTVRTKSIGMFYSYITGDLLRKRHRMPFCNGMSSYKYYGELVASITDAFEKIEIAPDKRYAVVQKYILPVIKNNFNICKEECVCLGTGCKRTGARPCNKNRFIDLEKDLNADCVSNMDIVSILTILFSVVGCKEILPQIFDKYDYNALDVLFDTVNAQLEKRFSEFDPKRVKLLRDDFYQMSLDYLSLDIDESKYTDPAVSQSLKPFKIRAYTDALISVLENLDSTGAEGRVNPIGNVYSIRNKIELISGIKNIKDVRSTLRDTLKIILTYHAGLASCKQQQLNYEVKAEQAFTLPPREVADCEKSIKNAFFDGVTEKLAELGENQSFYTLFKTFKEDNDKLKDVISVMLGREMINVRALNRFIELDEASKRCYLIARQGADMYRCDIDDEEQCELDGYKDTFVNCVVNLLKFFNGEDQSGIRFACYPRVLTHTSSRVNVDNTTISAFTACDMDGGSSKKEYNVITYFKYEIGKRYFYIAPKKFEKTRWVINPILVRCSEFYNKLFGGNAT